MKNYFILFLLIVFCACTQDEKEEQLIGSAIQLTANAATGSFTGIRSGTACGVYVVSRAVAGVEGTLMATGNAYDNQKFNFVDQSLTPESVLYYPQNVPAFDLYAYAPYSATGMNENLQVPFTVQSVQTDVAASDLLWSVRKGIKPTKSSNAMSFKHVLSKIEINITAGTDVTLASPTVIVANSKPTTLLDMKTGIPGSATGAVVSIQAQAISSTTTTVTFEAIVIPQTINSLDKFLTITNNGKTFYYNLPSSKEFKKGSLYKYNMTLNGDELEITLSGDVEEWISGGSTNADLTEDGK